MDMLHPDSGLAPEKWEIRTNIEADGRNADWQAARYCNGATVKNSLVSSGCVIKGTVVNSVLSPGVVVEEGAVVTDSILSKGVVVEKGAQLDLVVSDKLVRFGEGCIIGFGDNHDIANRLYPKHLYTGITLIGEKAQLPSGKKVGRNCIISCNTTPDMFVENLVQDGESL